MEGSPSETEFLLLAENFIAELNREGPRQTLETWIACRLAELVSQYSKLKSEALKRRWLSEILPIYFQLKRWSISRDISAKLFEISRALKDKSSLTDSSADKLDESNSFDSSLYDLFWTAESLRETMFYSVLINLPWHDITELGEEFKDADRVAWTKEAVEEIQSRISHWACARENRDLLDSDHTARQRAVLGVIASEQERFRLQMEQLDRALGPGL